MAYLIADKHNFITEIALRAALSVCMVTMVVGCIRIGESNPKPVTSGATRAGQQPSPSKSLATRSEELKDDQTCLTDAQKHAKLKELSEKDSWLSEFGEHTVVRGGGNLLGRVLGLGPAGEYVELANDTRKMTVEGNVARDSIDTIVARDCGQSDKALVPPDGSVAR